MTNDKSFSTFPSDISEALTMLYLQNQNLSEKAPEDIVELYYDTYHKIRNHKDEARSKAIKENSQTISY